MHIGLGITDGKHHWRFDAGGGNTLDIALGALGGAAGGAISNILPLGVLGNALIGAGAGGFISAIGH